MRIHQWMATTTLIAALCGCGGGGGGGSSSSNYPLKISVAQNPISASVAQIDLPAGVTFNASASGSTSAKTLYVVIVDVNATFTGAAAVQQTGDRQYSAELPLSDNLTIGLHSGTLQISICGDPGCGEILGRTNAPYSVNITENPIVTGEWSRASVLLAAVGGDESVTWPMKLTTPVLRYIPYARFSDPAGIVKVAGDSQTILAPWGSTNIDLVVSPSAPPGAHSGNLEMVYCRDAACTKMWRGVTQLPYTVSVYPATNLKTLVKLVGASDWTVYQGTPARTGHVIGTLNPANFSPRWRWTSPDPTNLEEILDPVISAGRVLTIAAPNPTIHNTPILYALDEATGAVAWQQPIPDTSDGPSSYGLGPLIPPAIAGDNVYVARTVNTYPPQAGHFFGFRIADGGSLFSPAEFSGTPSEFFDYSRAGLSVNRSARPTYMTPVNGSMWVARDDEAGARSFASLDLDDGAYTSGWSACPAAVSMIGSAGAIAVDSNGNSHVATGSTLLMPDSCESTTSTQPIADGTGAAVVPGTSSVAVVGGGNLVLFDSAARAVKWSVPESGTTAIDGSPAIVGETIYVHNNGSVQLEARRVSDGEVLWSWSPPWTDDFALQGNVVATDNLVFVSTTRRVYAIDLATHKAVWVYPYPGRLAISANGILFVLRSSIGVRSLAAINLH